MEEHNAEINPGKKDYTKYNTNLGNNLSIEDSTFNTSLMNARAYGNGNRNDGEAGGHTGNNLRTSIEYGEVNFSRHNSGIKVRHIRKDNKHFSLAPLSKESSPLKSNKYRINTDNTIGNVAQNKFYTERSRYNFEPAPLDDKGKNSHEQNAIQKTLDYWIEKTKFTLALPVVSAAGLDLLTKNRKLTLTRKVLGTYGKAIGWSVKNSPKVYEKAKGIVTKVKK